MNLATEPECKSIAFPLIATGVYGFSKDEALQIALVEINKFLLPHDMKVIFVIFDQKAFELSGKLVGDIEEYINEHSANEIGAAEYCGRGRNERYERPERLESAHAFRFDFAEEEEAEENEGDQGVIFADAAPAFMDISGKSLDDVSVHKKANIDRKV